MFPRSLVTRSCIVIAIFDKLKHGQATFYRRERPFSSIQKAASNSTAIYNTKVRTNQENNLFEGFGIRSFAWSRDRNNLDQDWILPAPGRRRIKKALEEIGG